MKHTLSEDHPRSGRSAPPRACDPTEVSDLRTGKALEARLEMLESIVASSFDAIVAVNQERVITFCNPAFTELFGYAAEEVVGHSARMLHASDEVFDEFGRTVFRIIQEKGRWRGEWTYRRKDGSAVHTETTYAERLTGREEPPGFIAVMRDVGDRKRGEKALFASEARFRELFEHMSSGVAVYEALDSGADFVFRDFNRAAEQSEKIDRREVIGRRAAEVFPGIEDFGLLQVMRRVWETGEPQRFPVTFYRDDRIEGWRENYVYKLPTGEIVAIYDDITERKKAEEALIESEERLQAILSATQVGIVIIDPEDHTIVDANPMAIDIIGLPREEIAGQICHRFICPAERGRCPVTDLGQAVDGKDRELIRGDGTRVPILKTVTQVMINGRNHLVESFLDITELKRMEEELRRLATTDALTGIANRRHFFELAEKELARALRYGRNMALVMFDIDHFKKINDRLGHPAGDAVLQRIAGAVHTSLRANDLFGRIGGEEFAVILPECDPDQAAQTAERLRQAVEALRVEHTAGPIACSISAGIAMVRGDAETLDSLIQRSDEALYAAKNGGRDQVCIAP